MKKIVFIFFLLIYIVLSPVQAFELVENSIYKYKDGIIYAIKKDSENSVCVIFANNTDTAQILYYNLKYTGASDYNNLLINLNSANKRNFNSNSEIKKIQENILLNIEDYKVCPNNICVTTNDILENHYSNRFLNLSVDNSIQEYVPNYKVKQFIKQVKKTINASVSKKIPKHSYNIIILFQVDTNDGSVKNLKIINNKALTKSEDKMYRKAISKSAPFKVPKEFKNVYDVINIKMKFNWNVKTFY